MTDYDDKGNWKPPDRIWLQTGCEEECGTVHGPDPTGMVVAGRMVNS